MALITVRYGSGLQASTTILDTDEFEPLHAGHKWTFLEVAQAAAEASADGNMWVVRDYASRRLVAIHPNHIISVEETPYDSPGEAAE